MQTPNRKPCGSLPFLFSPLVHTPFPYRQWFQRHLQKERKATISVPAGCILFPAPAGPSHINGCKINSSPCMCSVFLLQPLGAVALQLMNFSTFPSGFALSKQYPNPVRNLPRKYQCWLVAGCARKPHPTAFPLQGKDFFYSCA